MANTIDFILTTAADELISKVLSGKTLNFTRMAVGDGFSYDINVAKGFKNVVNEVLSLDITKKETLSPKSVKITSAFKNTDVQKEFYYREVGLYAQDPDTGEEVLYAYGNRNDAAELITPTSSNVVTKQLVFVISVGDSANVTFNVNADVYALQEDMLDVQANKADKNLANTGMITNCLLEVPQRIKYELANGIITIKAGSVAIVPYGTKDLRETYPVGSTFLNSNYKVFNTQFVDGKFFVWVEIQADRSISNGNSGSRAIFLKYNGILVDSTTANLFSGDTEPQRLYTFRWYDTSSNYIKECVEVGTEFITGTYLSLPLMVVNVDSNLLVTSINQVFNGIGYMGSTIWVDKGVKGLIPNGRNPDGTLNNIEWEQSSICVRTFANSETYDVILGLNGDAISRLNYTSQINYNEDDNIIYINGDPWYYSFSGAFKLTAGVISNLKIYQPFQAVNRYSDKPWLSSLSMPSAKYDELEIKESGSTYTAPANGYFVVRCISTNEGYFILYNYTTGVFEERQPGYLGAAVTPRLEVRKGDVVQIEYSLDLSDTKILRFYYAQGEVN